MPLPTNFIETLIYLHPTKIMEWLKQRSKSSKSTLWQLRNELAPSDLYCYFTARFGRPNGLQNFLRTNDSDNLIHWEWTFSCDYGFVSFLGMNFRTEVCLIGEFPFVEADKQNFIAQIKSDFAKYGQKMSEVRKSLEHWTEFVNPYHRLSSSVSKLMIELEELQLQPEDEAIPDLTNAEQFLNENWANVLTKYTKGLGLCFGIRSMLPVMAEAYVNLLLFVLMRPDLRADDRLRENTIRQPIDIRLKSLHMTCIGFEGPVDYSTEACKAYHTLVNERNDMLHGNVVLEKLRFNDLYFNGTVPIFKQYRSLWERTVGVEIGAVGLHKLHQEVAVVNELISYLTTLLKPELRAQFQRISSTRDLGLRTGSGRIGILFPGYLVDMFLPVSEPHNDDAIPEA